VSVGETTATATSTPHGTLDPDSEQDTQDFLNDPKKIRGYDSFIVSPPPNQKAHLLTPHQSPGRSTTNGVSVGETTATATSTPHGTLDPDSEQDTQDFLNDPKKILDYDSFIISELCKQFIEEVNGKPHKRYERVKPIMDAFSFLKKYPFDEFIQCRCLSLLCNAVDTEMLTFLQISEELLHMATKALQKFGENDGVAIQINALKLIVLLRDTLPSGNLPEMAAGIIPLAMTALGKCRILLEPAAELLTVISKALVGSNGDTVEKAADIAPLVKSVLGALSWDDPAAVKISNTVVQQHVGPFFWTVSASRKGRRILTNDANDLVDSILFCYAKAVGKDEKKLLMTLLLRIQQDKLIPQINAEKMPTTVS